MKGLSEVENERECWRCTPAQITPSKILLRTLKERVPSLQLTPITLRGFRCRVSRTIRRDFQDSRFRGGMEIVRYFQLFKLQLELRDEHKQLRTLGRAEEITRVPLSGRSSGNQLAFFLDTQRCSAKEKENREREREISGNVVDKRKFVSPFVPAFPPDSRNGDSSPAIVGMMKTTNVFPFRNL